MATAAIVVIGNEILSGKVVDTNSPYLSRELRGLGVDVLRIVVIPDDIDTIASEVRIASDAHDLVFTSGGVGPTHDDLTMDGVAKAFGVPIEVNETVVARIERAVGQPANASQRKMAALPAGALLIDAGDLWFPVVVIENVHIFPGILHGYMMPGNATAFDARTREFSMARALAILAGLRLNRP